MQIRQILWLCTLCGMTAAGQPMSSQLKTSDIVTQRTAEIPHEVALNALQKVLTKRSGQSIVLKWKKTQPSIETMIDQYDFERSTCLDHEAPTCYKLTMQFNQDSIENFMASNQIKAWGTKRPNVLIWLSQKTETSPQLISSYHPIAAQLSDQAKARALTLILPSGDISDQQVQRDDIPDSTIEYLKNKYHVDTILTGTIEGESTIIGSWQYHEKQLHHWQSESASLADAFSNAIDHIALYEKKQNDIELSQTPSTSILEIKNVFSIDDFVHISHHLMQYEYIQDVSIATIGPSYIAVEVKHQQSTEELLSQLQNDTALQSSIDSPNFDKAQGSYEWITPINTSKT